MSSIAGWTRSNRLIVFFALVFAVSWCLWPAYALGLSPEPVLPWRPPVAALAVIGGALGRSLSKELIIMSQTTPSTGPGSGPADLARRHPITAFLVILLVPTWTIYAVALLTGMPFMAAKFAELVFLIVAPIVVTRWIGGGAAVRRLYSGLTRWRLGLPRYLMILVAMPALTLLVAVITGTLTAPTGGWANMALIYAVFVLVGALTGNLWEETAWGGFMQGRLMARRACRPHDCCTPR